MDVQSGESKEEEVMGEGIGESETEEWYQNEVEVNEKTKEADSRDKVKHNERSDQLFLERMMKLASKSNDG